MQPLFMVVTQHQLEHHNDIIINININNIDMNIKHKVSSNIRDRATSFNNSEYSYRQGKAMIGTGSD